MLSNETLQGNTVVPHPNMMQYQGHTCRQTWFMFYDGVQSIIWGKVKHNYSALLWGDDAPQYTNQNYTLILSEENVAFTSVKLVVARVLPW